MLKRALLIGLSLIGLATSVMVLQAPALTFAATPQDEVCGGIKSASGSSDCTSSVSLTTVVRNAIKIFSILIGVVAVIMIMVGGFKYITSGGDSSSISSAKSTILYAIIGLVVAALSQAIVFFVLKKVG